MSSLENALWESYSFQTLLNDLFKVRKDAELGKMRLKILLDFVESKKLAPGVSGPWTASQIGGAGGSGGFIQVSDAGIPKPPEPASPPWLRAILAKPPKSWTPAEQAAVAKWDDEHMPTLPKDDTPTKRIESAMDTLKAACEGKHGEFLITLPESFDVSNIPNMLTALSIPYEQVEGAQPFSGPLQVTAQADGTVTRPNKAGSFWQVKMRSI